MVLIAVKCPFCGSEDVVKYGKTQKENSYICVGTRSVHTPLFQKNTAIMPVTSM